jgi:hypothetical protein
MFLIISLINKVILIGHSETEMIYCKVGTLNFLNDSHVAFCLIRLMGHGLHAVRSIVHKVIKSLSDLQSFRVVKTISSIIVVISTVGSKKW